jgi:hypothetical protein
MKILIVNKSDLKIVSKYDADAPDQTRYGGPWGDASQTEHIICSPAFDPDCVVAERDENGILSAVLDDDLVAAKLERDWVKLRVQRDAKLAACDWTVLSDSPLNTTDKNAWKDYRTALRDLPENTEDPTAPVWPSEPNREV